MPDILKKYDRLLDFDGDFIYKNNYSKIFIKIEGDDKMMQMFSGASSGMV